MATSLDGFSDLVELGIDCNDDSLTETFNQAANHLQNLVSNLDNQTLLTLYAFYKQGSQGPCNTPKPSWYDMKAKSKWEAWNKLGEMPQKEAQMSYIETIKKLDPNFNVSEKKESWVSVSVLQNDQSTNQKGEKTIIDYVKEDDSVQVSKLLNTSEGKQNINTLDTDGLGLIHWAADRGSVHTLKILIDSGADIDLQDTDGQTALHYASSCGHVDCLKFLLENGAKLNVVDNDGASPEDVACDDGVKELLVGST